MSASRAAAAPRALQSAVGRGSGSLQEAILQARRPQANSVRHAHGGTERLGRETAARGLVVASGMGIDAIAHQRAWLSTAAPSACWDRSRCLLPQGKQETLREGTRTRREHQRVPAGHAPCPENFPIRNRIIAGLPLGVVVVKGAQYSGSLITARLTMEFGREVFGCTGQCDPTCQLRPQPADPAGRQVGHEWRERDRRAPTPIHAALVSINEPVTLTTSSNDPA
jgi:hypothetical protein